MEPGPLRLIAKVARLYHVRGLRQTEIATRLGLSQSRVSRLLSQAEEAGLVRTVVVAPTGVRADLEDVIEIGYGLDEVHVVDVVAADADELELDLGQAAAGVLAGSPLHARAVGYDSTSLALRHCAAAAVPQASASDVVVEVLGDLGTPAEQHDAACSTARLAQLLGAEPLYLRAPGVVPDARWRELLLAHDGHVRGTLAALDDLDAVLVGVAPMSAGAEPRHGSFTSEQLALARAGGAVGQVCHRFLDEAGAPLDSALDDLVIGITAEQLRRAPRRIGVAGGGESAPAVRAALLGGWLTALVTDSETATRLAAGAPRKR